ncbi:DUF222 domain-containing protein [Mycobacterium sp. 21AC1]|uniref:DUF222 domain-containing protein n=1 Tax=[Mycobacterium] appelbergii TaxID=2939269 RepID=UPI002938DCC8|nr:DUF222 domain-containing protein [Mycobacterium sp. 21AC1]MDV3130190.1 DUF222 domain-containing protein [Mycobacterium sp. 21AC1]
MSSILVSEKDILSDALDHLASACREIDALSVHGLTRSELQEVLSRLYAGEKRLAAVQQRLLGRMVATGTAAPPQFNPAGVLARRLRISLGEAKRRIEEAAPPAA